MKSIESTNSKPMIAMHAGYRRAFNNSLVLFGVFFTDILQNQNDYYGVFDWYHDRFGRLEICVYLYKIHETIGLAGLEAPLNCLLQKIESLVGFGEILVFLGEFSG